MSAYGGIDVVVANAGISSYGSVMGVDPETFKRVLDINVAGRLPHRARDAARAGRAKRLRADRLVAGRVRRDARAGAYNASKAGVEHFGNALRLEVRHQGVDVGVAHMSWVDTPLVQDAKQDLTAFQKALAALPPPMNRTASVESCAAAFVKGIVGRKRHVYVPGWVAALAQLRNVVNSPALERETNKHTPTLLPLMDEEVRRLGRSTSARNK